jgi:hypothetical protein
MERFQHLLAFIQLRLAIWRMIFYGLIASSEKSRALILSSLKLLFFQLTLTPFERFNYLTQA